MRSKTVLAALCSLSLLSQYSSAHFDFTPRIDGGRVVVGGYDDGAGDTVSTLRVNGYDFGETADDPYNITDPGFNTLGASTFTGGTTLRLTAVATGGTMGGTFLRYWNGVGEPTFAPAAAGTTVSLSASPTRTLTFSAAGTVATPAGVMDLQVGTFGTNGSLHAHLGTSIAAATPAVPEGAYLIAFALTNPGTGVNASEPIYVVYNNGLTESQHDAAIEAATAAYVPEPGVATLLSGVLVLTRRRRRGIAK